MSAAARLEGVSTPTVARLLVKAGQAAMAFHNLAVDEDHSVAAHRAWSTSDAR